MSAFLLMGTLTSIWCSLALAIFMLLGALHFWLRESRVVVAVEPLPTYPTVSIIVPAHNEALVIERTVQALLDLNYPADRVELLLFADNCQDQTAQLMRATTAAARQAGRAIRIIERQGQGGKAGVLNDALKLATGEYLAVYDADAMPEENALYFLVQKLLENPRDYVAVFGRNKTRNAQQNFLTRCINQEIMTSQRIQHCASWHLFQIGRIPGTNFILRRSFAQAIGGWRDGALTEDTDISFKIMETGKLIALAHNSEAFQQEPETLAAYYRQRLRWAKGNYQVVLHHFGQLFRPVPWRVKLMTLYQAGTFLWFNLAIVCSDVIWLSNLAVMGLRLWQPQLALPWTFGAGNILLTHLLLLNWVLMILVYVVQINIAMATQYGQATIRQIWLALASYFTYAQLFIVVSVHAMGSMLLDGLLHRDSHQWVKTRRFAD